MLFLAGACVAIGLIPVASWPVVSAAARAWNPAWTGVPSPAPLSRIGALNVVLAAAGVAALALLWKRMRSNGVRRTLTWDCGYAAPAASMQYTAGSFACVIVGWFDWILAPVSRGAPPDGTFPSGAGIEERVPETVLERVVEPAGGAVMRIAMAARRLQHGRLQWYLVYLLAGVAALGALAVGAGGR
jgi:hydrogenase-4 component B